MESDEAIMNPSIEHLIRRLNQRGWNYGQIVEWFGDQNYVPQSGHSVKAEVQTAFDNLVMESMERILIEYRVEKFLASLPPCRHCGGNEGWVAQGKFDVRDMGEGIMPQFGCLACGTSVVFGIIGSESIQERHPKYEPTGYEPPTGS